MRGVGNIHVLHLLSMSITDLQCVLGSLYLPPNTEDKHIFHPLLFIPLDTSFTPGVAVKTRKLTHTNQL